MGERAMPTGTVSFLFTDIEGSTRRWERFGPAMAEAVARHDAIMRAGAAAYGGRVFKTVGDAFCVAFARAADALAAALDLQHALAAEEWGPVGPVRVRMAIHAGQAEERDADYFGPAVNRVARLLAAGHGGQVLLSRAAEQLVRDALPAGVTLRDMGEHRLKDLERPEHVFQVTAPGLAPEFAPLVTLDRATHNLPVQPTPFVGRERELTEVRALLARPDARLVTLTGPGGTGKTRLALQIAAESVEAFADGAWFVPLEEAPDHDRVVASVATVLGVPPEPGRPPAEAVVDAVRSRVLLLDLDNLEQVVEDAAPFVARLLAASPGSKVLATSRIRLRVRGEHEYPLGTLGLPPATARDPEALLASEAVRLFVVRATTAEPRFALTAGNGPVVAQICRALDGLPLAIELAAARVKLLPPRAMLTRLQDSLGLLVGGERDRPERHRTLEATIAWSYDLLSAEERTLFARLAVFAGGFDLEAAEAVANPGAELDLLRALGGLVDHSLVRQETTADGEARFALLATIRAFARDRLEAAGGGEAELTHLLHAEHYRDLAESSGGRLGEPGWADWVHRIEAEYDNLRAALRWCFEAGQIEQGARMAASLVGFWTTRGHAAEGQAWVERALDASDQASALRPRLLLGAGQLARARLEPERAAERLRAALALAEETDEAGVRAKALQALGILAMEHGDDATATVRLAACLALYRELGDRHAVAEVLLDLGNVASRIGDAEAAVARYRESLAEARASDERWVEASALSNLGLLASLRSDHTAAVAWFGEALAIFRELGDEPMVAALLGNTGMAAREAGQLDRADTLLREGLALMWQLEQTAHVPTMLEGLAGVAAAQGRGVRAARLLGAAEALRAKTGMPRPSYETAMRERDASLAQAAVGAEAYATAWAAGGALPLDEAVAEATAVATAGRRAG